MAQRFAWWRRELGEELRSNFGLIVVPTLTLRGLIIGFTLAMAVARYDLRKHYEEREANAIGTDYLRAALLQDVPVSARTLLAVIAIFCNLLIGYGRHGKSTLLFLILPIALAISFLLIANIGSPRGGVIRIQPENLQSLMSSLPH